MFTLQDNLPAETVQIITYGAPEFSAYLAMSLSGDGEWKMLINECNTMLAESN
jgi:hypothetical protein